MNFLSNIATIFLSSLFLISSSTAVKIDFDSKLIEINEKSINACVPSQFKIENPEDKIEFENILDFTAIFISNSDSIFIPLNFGIFLPSLEYFYFIESNLIEINEKSFKNLTNLIELNLNSNEISIISENSFDELKKLRKINLNDNKIENLPATIFRENLNLFSIQIHTNDIKKLPPTIFHGLANLEEIKLDDNYIEALPGRLLVDNKKLKNFTICNNEISQIGDESFEIFENLRDHNFLENKCTQDLPTYYRIDELIKLANENCQPACEEKLNWVNEELKETSPRGKRSVDDSHKISSNFLKSFEAKFVNQKDFLSLREELKKLTESFKKISDENKILSEKIENLKNETKNVENLNSTEDFKTFQNELNNYKITNEIEHKKLNDTINFTTLNFNKLTGMLDIEIQNETSSRNQAIFEVFDEVNKKIRAFEAGGKINETVKENATTSNYLTDVDDEDKRCGTEIPEI